MVGRKVGETKGTIVKALFCPETVFSLIFGLKHLYFQIVVLEETLVNPLDFKETKPVNPKENQP